MGFFAEKTAADHKISREDNDKYAISSYEKAIEAQKNKLFLNEIVPVKPKDNSGEEIAEDEGPKKFMPDKIPKLKTCFK